MRTINVELTPDETIALREAIHYVADMWAEDDDDRLSELLYSIDNKIRKTIDKR